MTNRIAGLQSYFLSCFEWKFVSMWPWDLSQHWHKSIFHYAKIKIKQFHSQHKRNDKCKIPKKKSAHWIAAFTYRASLIHEDEGGNACTRLVKAIDFHPNVEVIPETRISVLSCIQPHPLSPQGDFFGAIKFNNHGNFLYPPSSSAATSGSLTTETCPEKPAVMLLRDRTSSLKRAWSWKLLCLNFWKEVFRKRAQGDDSPPPPRPLSLWSSSAEEECVLLDGRQLLGVSL